MNFINSFTDPEVFRQAKTILLEMGYFYQVQDDFIDCFGDPAITGKIGTDIQDNKCSWLAVVCMQRATEEQKEIMRECYAQNGMIFIFLYLLVYCCKTNLNLINIVFFCIILQISLMFQSVEMFCYYF